MYSRVWRVECQKDGFTYLIFVRATELHLNVFINSSIPDARNYVGATETEVAAAKLLNIPIYLFGSEA